MPAAPGAAGRLTAARCSHPVNRTLLLQQVLNGLAIGSVYAIFALGYTLIFSVLRIINFTHGAIFTLGAYATYALTGSPFGINGLLAGATVPFKLPFVLALVGDRSSRRSAACSSSAWRSGRCACAAPIRCSASSPASGWPWPS